MIPKNTTISFDAGEHGKYDTIPSSITLTERQEIDITDSAYMPNKIEINYIFKGFSYSGNTFKAEYKLSTNTVNVDIEKYEQVYEDTDGNKYAKLKYIECNGNQYIDLGTQTVEYTTDIVESKFKYNTLSLTSDALWLYSCQATGSVTTPTDFYSQSGHFATRMSNGTAIIAHDTKIHTLKVDGPNNVIYFDSSTYDFTPTSGTMTGVMNLFRRNTGIGYANISLFSFSFSKEGLKVFDLVPALKIDDGIAGLFDVKNNHFYQNSGSGNFYYEDNISYDINAGYIIAVGDYNLGSQLTLTACANSGYYFVKWGDGDTNPNKIVTIGSDDNLMAIFAENN